MEKIMYFDSDDFYEYDEMVVHLLLGVRTLMHKKIQILIYKIKCPHHPNLLLMSLQFWSSKILLLIILCIFVTKNTLSIIIAVDLLKQQVEALVLFFKSLNKPSVGSFLSLLGFHLGFISTKSMLSWIVYLLFSTKCRLNPPRQEIMKKKLLSGLIRVYFNNC